VFESSLPLLQLSEKLTNAPKLGSASELVMQRNGQKRDKKEKDRRKKMIGFFFTRPSGRYTSL
jgi:hypothetical protein